MMAPDPGTTGAFIDVATHVSKAVCLDLSNDHRIVRLRIPRSLDPAPAAAAPASPAIQSIPLLTRRS